MIRGRKIAVVAGIKPDSHLPYKQPLTSVHFVVAVRAIGAGFVRLMAVHATGHIDFFRLVHLLKLFDFAVASYAGRARCQMRAMAEKHVAGNFIHASPFDFALVFGKASQLLNRRTVAFDFFVALHARRRRRRSP